MMSLEKALIDVKISKALEFAMEAHRGQKRKYIEEDYINHPMRVARMVVDAIGYPAAVYGDHIDVVVAALLHDVVEDSDVSVADIGREFGWMVANHVQKLSNPGPGPGVNRASRKLYELLKMEDASPEVKLIRLADMLDNAPSIIEHDPKFAKLMVKEKRELLPLLVGSGYPEMFEAVYRILYVDYENSLKKGE